VSDIDFYEVVTVLTGPDATATGVSGSRGIVVGVSGTADDESYAVLIDGRTVMLGRSELARTGERVDREAIYGGETIQVSPQRYVHHEP
jgi:hypothetical protein